MNSFIQSADTPGMMFSYIEEGGSETFYYYAKGTNYHYFNQHTYPSICYQILPKVKDSRVI